MSKLILKISILKNIKRQLRTLYSTHVLFQCILLCFDTLPLDRDIPNLDRDVLSLNDHDISLLDRDIFSLNNRDIPLFYRDVLSPDDHNVLAPLLNDRDVLTLGISDHNIRILT